MFVLKCRDPRLFLKKFFFFFMDNKVVSKIVSLVNFCFFFRVLVALLGSKIKTILYFIHYSFDMEYLSSQNVGKNK